MIRANIEMEALRYALVDVLCGGYLVWGSASSKGPRGRDYRGTAERKGRKITATIQHFQLTMGGQIFRGQ